MLCVLVSLIRVPPVWGHCLLVRKTVASLVGGQESSPSFLAAFGLSLLSFAHWPLPFVHKMGIAATKRSTRLLIFNYRWIISRGSGFVSFFPCFCLVAVIYHLSLVPSIGLAKQNRGRVVLFGSLSRELEALPYCVCVFVVSILLAFFALQ